MRQKILQKKSLFWGGRVEQLARALKIQSLKSIRMQMQEKFKPQTQKYFEKLQS